MPGEKIPVVFIHTGKIPVYLANAIDQAAAFHNDVILVTDNQHLKLNAKVVQADDINHDEQEFESYYRHMSTNSYAFEYICIYRWFLLKNLMIKHNLSKVLYLDSDVYLYENTENVVKHYPEFGCAYNVPEISEKYYWAGSACCSFWNIRSITEFCYCIKNYYTTPEIKTLEEKWKFHAASNTPGGVCDMTFLYLFSGFPGFLNLGKVHNGCSFDFNNAISDNYYPKEYAMKRSRSFDGVAKDIRFVNGMPLCKNIISGKDVRFFALTEYAKLLDSNKKLNFFESVKTKLYRIKKKIFK